MISELTKKIISIIKGSDIKEVYPAFDNIPIESKSSTFCTIVMPTGVNGENVREISNGTAYNFEITFDIICAAEKNFSAVKFYDFLQDKVIERIISPENDMTVISFKTYEPVFDHKIQKMTLKCSIKIGGVYIINR